MRQFSLSFLTASSLTAPEAVAAAAQFGYTHVGLRLAPSMPGGPFQDLVRDKNLLQETVARCRDTGVAIFDIEVIRIGENFDAGNWLSLLETAAVLEARAILVVGDDTNETRLAQSLGRLCESARAFGTTIDLEFLPWTAIRDAGSALHVIEAAGSPQEAGILIDALHFARSTSTLAEIAALPREYLHYAQICDGPGDGTYSREQMIHTAVEARLLPGEGGIDLHGLFAALPSDMPISVEIPNRDRVQKLGPLEWVRQAMEASRRVFHT